MSEDMSFLDNEFLEIYWNIRHKQLRSIENKLPIYQDKILTKMKIEDWNDLVGTIHALHEWVMDTDKMIKIPDKGRYFTLLCEERGFSRKDAMKIAFGE